MTRHPHHRRRPARPALRPAPSPRGILAIVLTGQFMALLDASVVNVAPPRSMPDLHASGAGLQLVIAGYVIPYAVLLVTGARLGDILGHRRMFLAGLALFTLASLGCGLALDQRAGHAAVRAGGGAAVMIPQVLSLIQRSFTGPARARPMRLYAAVLAGGAVAGQVLGGAAGQRGPVGQHVAPGVPAERADRGVLLVAGGRLLPRGGGEPGPRAGPWPGWPPCPRPCWPWCCRWCSASPSTGRSGAGPAWPQRAVAFAAFCRWWSAGPRPRARVAPDPRAGAAAAGRGPGIAALFATLAVFGGFFFALALHLQGGLEIRRCGPGSPSPPPGSRSRWSASTGSGLPPRGHAGLIIVGFAGNAAGLLALAVLLHGGRPRRLASIWPWR